MALQLAVNNEQPLHRGYCTIPRTDAQSAYQQRFRGTGSVSTICARSCSPNCSWSNDQKSGVPHTRLSWPPSGGTAFQKAGQKAALKAEGMFLQGHMTTTCGVSELQFCYKYTIHRQYWYNVETTGTIYFAYLQNNDSCSSYVLIHWTSSCELWESAPAACTV